jgi:hypothetical protein
MDMNMNMNVSQGMVFTTNIAVTILFNGCVPTTTGQFVAAWFVVFFLAIVYELVCAVEASWKLTLPKQRSRIHPLFHSPYSMQEVGNIFLGALFTFLSNIRYILMLVVMTGQVGLFFAVVVGHTLGSFLFGPMNLWQKFNNVIDDDILIDGSTLNEKNLLTSSYFGFYPSIPLFILPRITNGVYFVVLFTWIYNAEGGIGFGESNLFGFHALLMSFFVMLFMSESILSFHSPLFGPIAWLLGNEKKIWRKIIHIMLQIGGLISCVCGLVAIVYYKSLAPLDEMGNQSFPFYTLYSGHSWLGLLFIFLWLCQSLLKLAQIPINIHRFLGKVVFVIGLATCAMGFQDMQSSDLSSSTSPGMNMSGMNMSGYFPDSVLAQSANACIYLIVFFGIFIFAIFQFSEDIKTEPVAKELDQSNTSIDLSSSSTQQQCCDQCQCG